MTVNRTRARRTVVAITAVLVLVVGLGVSAPPAAAQQANPVPLTDVFGQTVALLTGGSQRICATSAMGFPVHCVEGPLVMPSALPGASGVTFGHWVFCRTTCTGGLLAHEMVHVHQFEAYGDLFGPIYLAEAAVHGTGCENQYERPAYGDQCP